jgi:hypothetical protein
MNEERTGKCIRLVEHIRSHLWHRYSIAVNQVVVATVNLSKWWPMSTSPTVLHTKTEYGMIIFVPIKKNRHKFINGPISRWRFRKHPSVQSLTNNGPGSQLLFCILPVPLSGKSHSIHLTQSHLVVAIFSSILSLSWISKH